MSKKIRNHRKKRKIKYPYHTEELYFFSSSTQPLRVYRITEHDPAGRGVRPTPNHCYVKRVGLGPAAVNDRTVNGWFHDSRFRGAVRATQEVLQKITVWL